MNSLSISTLTLQSLDMPELPEVENVRQGLDGRVTGQIVTTVTVMRQDVIHGCASPAALLRGQRITGVTRHGKQLALLGCNLRKPGNPPCVCIHLGMSGSLRYVLPRGVRTPINGERIATATRLAHTHVIWHLGNGGQIQFRDPRRFGGIWPFHTRRLLLRDRWEALGNDAMIIQPRQLYRIFQKTKRVIKVVLLDQTVVAGMGNIYIDELLHQCNLHPLTPCRALDMPRIQLLVRRMRHLLARATHFGGSTLRDYVDSSGQPGTFQTTHRVYGRGGNPCLFCQITLGTIRVSGRRTVYCPQCQPRRPVTSSKD